MILNISPNNQALYVLWPEDELNLMTTFFVLFIPQFVDSLSCFPGKDRNWVYFIEFCNLL